MVAHETEKQRIARNVAKAIGMLGCLLSVAFLPPVFNTIFAIGSLSHEESVGLWVFFGIISSVSAVLIFKANGSRQNLNMLFFSFLMLLSVELFARIFFNLFAPEDTKKKLTLAVGKTHEDFMAYKGHPFMSFIGVEGVSIVGNQRNETSQKFNNLGFLGKEFVAKKDSNIIRIAALGGSTTARGYPSVMESYLNHEMDSVQFEVMNFGMTYWTTAHSMINFLLNVVDMNPDYVIIHHAWNDSKPRGAQPGEFKNDYSHALTYFHEPEIHDRIPIQISILYRYFKFFHSVLPTWAYLENATSVPNRQIANPLYGNLDELKPYERNIRTIIDVAILRGIKVLLTTQPYCNDLKIPHYYAHEHIKQCNEIVRRLATEYGNAITFFDLDQNMYGKMDSVFEDVGHMDEAGKQYKAEHIGQAILRDIEALAPGNQ